MIVLTSVQLMTARDDSFSTLKKLRLKVLNENSIGKEFEYDLTGQAGCNKTKLTYLGIVTTNKQKQYKLLNSFFVTGYSCRGIRRLVIYDDNNVYLGNYAFEGNLPSALKNNELVFKANQSCANKKEIKISLKTGLPNSFNVCGETITFSGEE